MNLINVDVQSVFMFLQMNNMLVQAPFVLGIAIILICLEVGLVGLVTLLILIVATFLQGKINIYAFMLRAMIMVQSDKRAKAITEFFSGIRIIKYYAWENMVTKKVSDIESKKLQCCLKIKFSEQESILL